VLIYTSLRKRFTPPSETRNAEEAKYSPIHGADFYRLGTFTTES
jgi:hypothetical protein